MTNPTPNLPAPLGTATGALDIDALAALNVGLRANLEHGLSVAVAQIREARGAVVTQEDTYDLVRRLAQAQEVLQQTGKAFTDAAKAALQHTEEELRTAVGEQDGIPTGRMIVPTGAHEYVVAPAYRAGTDTWDTASLVGVLADLAVDGQPVPTTDPDNDGVQAHEKAMRDYANEVAADAMTAMLKLLAAPKWKSTEVDALRRKLAAAGRDDLAGTLGQVRQRGERVYTGVTVDLEEAKARRRS